MPAPMFPRGPLPPPFGYPFPPPPQRGGLLRRLSTAILIMLLIGSVLLNILLLLGGGLEGMGGSATRTVLVAGDASQRIVVLPVEGILMGDASAKFNRLLDQAEKDQGLKALVLEIDTPGGAVNAADEIHHRLQRFKAEHPKVEVVVTMGGLATSGGYYVACAADYIYAQPTTLTGNIGVLMPRYNIAKLAERWGIQDATLHSTGADFKNVGSPLKEETPEHRAYLTGLIDEAFREFKSKVVNGRKLRDEEVNRLANGKIYTAKQAVDLGLVDQVGYPDEAYRYIAKKLSLSKPQVVKYHYVPSLIELLGGQSSSSRTAASAAAEGLNVKVDARLLEHLLAPRPMYLWMGQ